MLAASRDTWTAENPGWRSNAQTTVDHGNSPSLVVGNHGPERGYSIGFIDFDMAGVPRGRHLQSAHLELFALRSDGGPATAPISPIEIRPVTGRWGESAPQDWEQPVGTRSASGTPWVHPARDAWARFDVTTEVRERLAGRDGQGWRLKSAWPVQIWTTRFGSRESEWPPRLVLVFADPDPAGRLFLPRLDTTPSRREVDETAWPWSEPLEQAPAPDDPLALELSLDSRS